MKITYTDNGCFPGKKLKGKERYKRLYHYTSFDTFVKIWLSKQLKFGEVSDVNDFQEAALNLSISNPRQIPLLRPYLDVKKSYKQISLTMDYDSYIKGCMSTMMWGTYGDRSKGVCIELDYEKLSLPKGALAGVVNYKSILDFSATLPSHLKTAKDVEVFIKKNKKNLFFTKQIDWNGENEYRILSKELDFLNISDAITAIYLTSNDSIECDLTEKLVNETVPVKFLRFINNQNKAIPVLIETKSSRMQVERAKSDQRNILNELLPQARETYQRQKQKDNASLLQKYYTLQSKRVDKK